ncbi:MAG: hypothetical protein QNJ56_05315 [Gammaproteobacteria bacterium]|nr:hypothetical protein [Gammaproteobacteria bacterium]
MRGLKQRGLSYIEVLIATVIIAVTLVPMLEGLQPGLQGSEIHLNQAQVHFTLQGKMEEVLAQPFDDLDAEALAAGSATTPTPYSNTGAAIPHEVFLSRWDVDNADADDNGFTGVEDDMLWVRVATTDGLNDLQTLLSPY